MPSFTLDLQDNLRQIFDYDGGSQVVFLGRAQPNATKGDSVWQIRRFTIVSSRVTETNFANGTLEFDKEWDERATYDYDPDS